MQMWGAGLVADVQHRHLQGGRGEQPSQLVGCVDCRLRVRLLGDRHEHAMQADDAVGEPDEALAIGWDEQRRQLRGAHDLFGDG